MTITLNHTIVWCHDQKVSAGFLTDLFGLPPAVHWGPFEIVEVANGVSLDYHEVDGEIPSQHYAFLVSEDEFDAIFGRIVERGLEHWADPAKQRAGRDQPRRRRARCLLRRSRRPPPRDHHSPLRERRLDDLAAQDDARHRAARCRLRVRW